MKHPQSSIVPDHAQAGIFLEADLLNNQLNTLKQACKKSIESLKKWQTKFPNDRLGLTLAFGHALWQQFGHSNEGSELKPFTALGNGLAPATQHDVMLHIQSTRAAVNLALMLEIAQHFDGIWQVAHETHGLRLLEERGLDGFVDGTENPHGDENVDKVGVIAQDKPDAGGSYVLLQKYHHNLKQWNALPIATQEAAVGRSKTANEEFSKEVRLPDSHLGRVNLKENGVGLKIVRRSLPFGTATGEHGLMFNAYCATLHNIEVQLKSMFGETDGKVDLLVQYGIKPVSGGYYYAPSEERLADL